MRSKTYVATPPGATIKEQLFDRKMSQKEFASRMDMSEKHISRLINGEVQLTPDVAMRLEMVLGLPARFWNNLESIYREKLSLVQVENEMTEDLETVKKLPYNEMVKNGWIEATRNATDKVMNLRKYFEVVRLSLISEPSISGLRCRKLGDGEKSDFALLAWAQKAKLEARNVHVESINIEKLKSILPEIRKMTVQNPSVFCDKLCEQLAGCGIALIFLPHFGGSFIHGATFYDGPKIVVGLTVRGKDADRFWFSLFHELGHIILGHLTNDCNDDKIEDEADNFAKNILISKEDYSAFIRKGAFDRSSIRAFSRLIGIDPGIVVGRLQKDGHLNFSTFNDMKTRYEITA